MSVDKDMQDQSALAKKSSTKISRREARRAGAKLGLRSVALGGGLGAELSGAPAVHAASKITLRYMHWEPELTTQAKWYRDVRAGFTKLRPGVVGDLIAMAPTIRQAGYTPLAWGNQLPSLRTSRASDAAKKNSPYGLALSGEMLVGGVALMARSAYALRRSER